MSVKHIKKEYERICADYHEMLESIHELEELVSEKAISPERIDELKAPLETMKANYMRWSYVMHLLNMPNKKQKLDRYNKQHSYIKMDKTEHEEDMEAISQFKSGINSL